MKDDTNIQTENITVMVEQQLTDDFKHSLLVISLLANVFILIAWVMLQVTSQYDYQVATFLFFR